MATRMTGTIPTPVTYGDLARLRPTPKVRVGTRPDTPREQPRGPRAPFNPALNLGPYHHKPKGRA